MVDIVVRRMPGHPTKGILTIGGLTVPCALGRSGINAQKREGDGGTPAGRFRLLAAYYRADRLPRPTTKLPIRKICEDDGWCDAPTDSRYNKPVKLPCDASHESMWRNDNLYDFVVVLDQNFTVRKRFGGSAIFFHVASAGLKPTEGCIALPRQTMVRVLTKVDRGSRMHILL